MAKNMTVEEASRIIKDRTEFGAEFDEAYNFLRENNPEELSSIKDFQAEKKARAKAYMTWALSEDEYGEKFDEARDVLKGDKKVQEEIAEEQKVYDEANHLDMEDEEAVVRNVNKVGNFLSDIDYKAVREDKKFSDVAEMMDRVELVDDTPADSADKQLSEEDIWTSVIENAKQQALMLRAGDMSFFMKKDAEKRRTLENDVKDFVTVSVIRTAAASAMPEPTAEETVAGSKEYENYLKLRTEKEKEAVHNLMNKDSKEKVQIKTSQVLTDAAETSHKLSSYISRWAQKGFNKVAGIFKKSKEDFDDTMKFVWGNRYEIKKAAVESVKNNRSRLITDAAMTAGVIGAAVLGGTGVGLAAAAGYGLYTAAGAWVWPLAERKAKNLRAAKKAGEDTKGLTGISGFRNAYAEIRGNEKEYKQYRRRAAIGTAAGVISAGFVGGSLAYATQAAGAIGYGATKVTASAIRAAGSNTSQYLNYRDVKKEFKAEPSAENRSKLKMAKFGLRAGLIFSAVASYLGFEHINGADKATEAAHGVSEAVQNHAPVTTGVTPEKTDSIWQKILHPFGGGNAAAVHENVTGAEAADVPASETVTAPAAYNADMGISEKHWDEMHRKLTGIYENHSVIFGKENVSSADAWNNMYQNLHNARAADPKLFGNMTDEQVLYKYMKLIENCERVEAGPKGYLVTKLGADGLPMYGDKKVGEVLRGMNAMLNCGDKAELSATDVKTVLGYVNENNGRYTGPGAGTAMTNNAYVGGRLECGEGYQNAWERGHSAVRHAVKKVVPQEPAPVQPTPAPVAEPKPAEVEEVVTNNEVKQKPAQVEEVVVNKQHRSGTLIRDCGAGFDPAEISARHSDRTTVPLDDNGVAVRRGGRER